MSNRHRIEGLVYGIPAGLSLAGGMFHILRGLEILEHEAMWGFFQLLTFAFFIVSFVVYVKGRNQ